MITLFILMRVWRLHRCSTVPSERSLMHACERGAFPEPISFSLEPGELLAFIGPNGAGKSTTIKMLTGIVLVVS